MPAHLLQDDSTRMEELRRTRAWLLDAFFVLLSVVVAGAATFAVLHAVWHVRSY